jgi:hypothetical protein
MPNDKYQRTLKGFLIYPKFQMMLVGINTVVMITVCAAIFWGVKSGYNSLEVEGLSKNIPTNHPYFNFLNYQSDLIFKQLFYCFLIGIVISNLAIIYISHKVAGPIVRLKNSFLEMKETKSIKDIHFRKDDFFDDLPQVVNEAMYSIKEGRKDYLKKVD